MVVIVAMSFLLLSVSATDSLLSPKGVNYEGRDFLQFSLLFLIFGF